MKKPLPTVLYQNSYVAGKETVWNVAIAGLTPAQARWQGARIVYFHEINQYQVLHSGYNIDGSSARKTKIKKFSLFQKAWVDASKKTPAVIVKRPS